MGAQKATVTTHWYYCTYCQIPDNKSEVRLSQHAVASH